MKIHVTDDENLRKLIREGLRLNEGYCPCVKDSKGKEEFKCICQEMLTKIQVGEPCHCGLYIKDEM